MGTKSIEYEVALNMHRSKRKELESVLYRMVGGYRQSIPHPREMRRKLAKQLGTISVSRMIIEAR